MTNQFYTAEIYKKDKRIKKAKSYLGSKNKVGLRFILAEDFSNLTKEDVQKTMTKKYPDNSGYTIEIFETYVVRKNLLTGKEFSERYDTPYYCSPSSETYFSM